MHIGRVGIWTFQLDLLPAGEAQEVAAELEQLGYRALWIPEALSREALTNSGLLLAGTESLVVATGIANIWGRDAYTMAAAHRTLGEAYPGRFLLGLGVSHAPFVEGIHDQRYTRPYTAMSEYLDAMDAALLLSPEPPQPQRRVLAALGPRMLELASERADGAHTYLVTPDHTAVARDVMGSDSWLVPEQAVVVETDPGIARSIARAHLALAGYLDLPNYANNLKRLGFDEQDLADGGSDRIVDALVAWGDETTILKRVREHLDAGADHVAVQVLTETPEPPRSQWAELAPALLAL